LPIFNEQLKKAKTNLDFAEVSNEMQPADWQAFGTI
jgi:hypothetical protein